MWKYNSQGWLRFLVKKLQWSVHVKETKQTQRFKGFAHCNWRCGYITSKASFNYRTRLTTTVNPMWHSVHCKKCRGSYANLKSLCQTFDIEITLLLESLQARLKLPQACTVYTKKKNSSGISLCQKGKGNKKKYYNKIVFDYLDLFRTGLHYIPKFKDINHYIFNIC